MPQDQEDAIRQAIMTGTLTLREILFARDSDGDFCGPSYVLVQRPKLGVVGPIPKEALPPNAPEGLEGREFGMKVSQFDTPMHLLAFLRRADEKLTTISTPDEVNAVVAHHSHAQQYGMVLTWDDRKYPCGGGCGHMMRVEGSVCGGCKCNSDA